MGLVNRQLVFAVIATSFGSGFHHGYNTAVIEFTKPVVQNWINESTQSRIKSEIDQNKIDRLWTVVVLIMKLGGAVGGVCTGTVCHRFGPKTGLQVNNMLAFSASILMGISKYVNSVEALALGRFILGVNNGLTCGLCPMYLTEIAPIRIRGGVATSYHLAFVTSLLLAQLSAMLFSNDRLWPVLFLAPIAIIACQSLALTICAESPRYLVGIKNNMEKAEKALQFLRRNRNVSEELEEIKKEMEDTKVPHKVTFRVLVTSPKYRLPLYITIFCMLAHQLTGINAVLEFSRQAFEGARIPMEAALMSMMAISGVHIITTIITMILVEKIGRKQLLLVGFGGMAVDSLLLSISLFFTKVSNYLAYGCIVFIFAFVILYASGSGPIPWFITSETFSQFARPTALSLTVPVIFIAESFVHVVLPLLYTAMGAWIFMVFVGFNLIFFAFMLLMLPSTRNRSITEITRELN